MVGGCRGGGQEGGEHEEIGWVSWGRYRRESKERDILIERAIMELGRNLVLGELPGIHKDDPS